MPAPKSVILAMPLLAFACNGGSVSGDGDGGSKLPKASGSVHASRLEGIAPLAVHFDGTDLVTSPRPFHDVGVHWSFDDGASGSWGTTGLSKNEAVGPLAAHVFETPGTYTVTATAHTGEERFTASVEIEVRSADGLPTLCISSSGDFDGCPAGATELTESDAANAIDGATDFRRILLRRGDEWTASDTVVLDLPGPGVLGAFGAGAAPEIRTGDFVGLQLSGRDGDFVDWRVMDLIIVGQAGGSGAKMVEAEGRVEQLLLYRLEGRQFRQGIATPGGKLSHYGHARHEDVAVVDCEVTDVAGNSAAQSLYLEAFRLVAMGNSISGAEGGTHVLRVPYGEDAIISHNSLSDVDGAYHVLKLHGPDEDSTGVYEGLRSRRILIAQNRFSGVQADWGVAIGPQSGSWDERLSDIVFERNQFLESDFGAHVVFSARDVTVRNNMFDLSGGQQRGVVILNRGVEPSPMGLSIIHNTCFSSGSERPVCVSVEDGADVVAQGNLLVATGSDDGRVVDDDTGAASEADNLVSVDGGALMSPSPVTPEDYRPAAASPAIDARSPAGPIYFDFFGAVRGQTQWDLGAVESNPGG